MEEIHSSGMQEEINDSSYERIEGMDGSPGNAEQEHAEDMEDITIEEEGAGSEIQVREETVSDQA